MSGYATMNGIETGSVHTNVLLQRIVAAVMAVLLLPLFLSVSIIVAIFLGRPLFFAQIRAGLNGAPFTILKFRSLSDRRDASGKLLPDERRMAPISRLLRRSRLDELPQLFCVARGDMSFFGPRPLLPETIAALGALGARRCSVRPGLTGWAQTCGNTFLDERSKIALDIWYIDHRSWLLDLRIAWATLVTLVRGERKNEEHINRALAFVEENYEVDNTHSQEQPQ